MMRLEKVFKPTYALTNTWKLNAYARMPLRHFEIPSVTVLSAHKGLKENERRFFGLRANHGSAESIRSSAFHSGSIQKPSTSSLYCMSSCTKHIPSF